MGKISHAFYTRLYTWLILFKDCDGGVDFYTRIVLWAMLPTQYPRVYLWVFRGEIENPTNNLPTNAKQSPTKNDVGKLTDNMKMSWVNN